MLKKGSSTLISWSHFPEEAECCSDLEYKVVEVGNSCVETVLERQKGDKKYMLVKGCHKQSLKVGVYFKHNPELGTVYSDLYKGKVML